MNDIEAKKQQYALIGCVGDDRRPNAEILKYADSSEELFKIKSMIESLENCDYFSMPEAEQKKIDDLEDMGVRWYNEREWIPAVDDMRIVKIEDVYRI